MKKTFLPYVDPMYSAYHYLASAGIPAKQNTSSDNWFYNNTVDWKCSCKFLQGFTTPELSLHTGDFYSIPFLEKNVINTRFARYCAVELIKTMLDDGFYVVFVGVDDYYVKGKCWYRQQHFYHDGLIVGYDDEDETFAIAGYDERWIFTVFKTPQTCFMQGLRSMCDQKLFGEIIAVKANNDIQEIDITTIYQEMKKYLSTNLELHPLNLSNSTNGIVVYELICMYLDKLIDGSIPFQRRDRRIFRLMWEHKKCMLGRIKAVESQCKWDDSLSNAYVDVVTLSNKIRFLYSKFVLKFSSKILESIQDGLMRMKELEEDILHLFSKKLSDEITNKSNN